VDQDLNIKLDTLNLIEVKVGKSIEFIGTGGNFLNRTPMTHALTSRIDKWHLMKLESFCMAKENWKASVWQRK
jgi:phage-related protein